MVRIAKTLAAASAITAVIAASSPLGAVTQDVDQVAKAADFIQTSDEVATVEFSASTSSGVSSRKKFSHRHIRRKTVHQGSGNKIRIRGAGTKIGTGTPTHTLSTGPAKLGPGPALLSPGPVKLGDGPGKLNTGPGAANATGYFYQDQAPNNATQPSTASTAPTTPTTEIIEVITETLTGEFPKWKQGNPLPPGWTSYTGPGPDGRPKIYIDPPHGYRSKKDGGLIPNRTDFDKLHAAVDECKKPYLKEANDYRSILAGIRAQELQMIKDREDTSEIKQQIKDTESMVKSKLDQANGCYDRLFKIFQASGYNSTE